MTCSAERAVQIAHAPTEQLREAREIDVAAGDDRDDLRVAARGERPATAPRRRRRPPRLPRSTCTRSATSSHRPRRIVQRDTTIDSSTSALQQRPHASPAPTCRRRRRRTTAASPRSGWPRRPRSETRQRRGGFRLGGVDLRVRAAAPRIAARRRRPAARRRRAARSRRRRPAGPRRSRAPIVPLPLMKSSSSNGCTNWPRIRSDRCCSTVRQHSSYERLDDRGAEPLDRAQLGLGRGVHHQHAAGCAGPARGQRDALRGVAGADRPDALGQLRRRVSCAHGVLRAADLERADRLQRFELQEDLRPGRRCPPGSSSRTSGVRTPPRRPVSAASRMVSSEMCRVMAGPRVAEHRGQSSGRLG